MTQRTKFFGLFAALTLIFTASASQAEPIKISYQPALYWALPFYVATQKGYWKDVGLEPEFSTFPAGVPQIAAAAAKSWDVGGTGSVPAVLGFARFGIMTIGITNDESATNALMVAGDKAAEYGNGKNLAAAKGKVITLTANSTADYAIQSCLKMAGLTKNDVVMKNMGQAEIISALSAGQTELAGLWSPNIYTVEEKSGAKMLCNGRDSGAIIPGALIARGDYATENPQNVAKFLAVYLRAWKWMNANKADALKMMKAFYAEGGVTISDAAMAKEFELRPTFDLSQQLANMKRSGGNSKLDGWMDNIVGFMRAVGTLTQDDIKAQNFVTDKYMAMVNDDAKLRAFASDSK